MNKDRYQHITNFTNRPTPVMNYRSAVEEYNRIYPGGLSIGRPSHHVRGTYSLTLLGLWMNTGVSQDMNLFWIIFDGIRFRSIKMEIDFDLLIRTL